jgi:phenylacetate-CoA ligase
MELSKNDEIVSENEFGEIISTGLNNYGMPLIRYKTGDTTKFKNVGCECGRHLPLINPVETKMEDMIIAKNGNVLSPSVLTHPFKPLTNIEKSQIIQESKDKLVIKIVKRPNYNEKDSVFLLNELRVRVGDMDVELEFVEDIPLTKAGKYRWIISKIPKEILL